MNWNKYIDWKLNYLFKVAPLFQLIHKVSYGKLKKILNNNTMNIMNKIILKIFRSIKSSMTFSCYRITCKYFHLLKVITYLIYKLHERVGKNSYPDWSCPLMSISSLYLSIFAWHHRRMGIWMCNFNCDCVCTDAWICLSQSHVQIIFRYKSNMADKLAAARYLAAIFLLALTLSLIKSLFPTYAFLVNDRC